MQNQSFFKKYKKEIIISTLSIVVFLGLIFFLDAVFVLVETALEEVAK